MTEYVKKSDVLELLSLPKDLIAEYVCDLKGLWIDDDEAEQTEPQTERIKTLDYCDICNHKGCDNCIANNLDDYCVPSGYAPKDTPQTDCDTCRHYKLACELFSEICKYEPTTQTETQNSNFTFEKDECAKEYEELGLKELKKLIEADRKDEPTCDTCRHKGVEGCEQPCLGCGRCGLYEAMTGNDKLKEKVVEFIKSCARCKHRPIGAMMCEESCHYEPKDEPQTCEECEHWNDTEDGCADRHGCKVEPQTDCAWK